MIAQITETEENLKIKHKKNCSTKHVSDLCGVANKQSVLPLGAAQCPGGSTVCLYLHSTSAHSSACCLYSSQYPCHSVHTAGRVWCHFSYLSSLVCRITLKCFYHMSFRNPRSKLADQIQMYGNTRCGQTFVF